MTSEVDQNKEEMTKKQTTCLILIIVIFFLPAGVFLLYVYKNFGIKPVNINFFEIQSPDQKYKAVFFNRDAGATTGFNAQISILKINSTLPDDGGNVFICDSDHKKAPVASWGGPELRLEWHNSDKLKIQYHENVRVFKSEKQFENIEIEYEKLKE